MGLSGLEPPTSRLSGVRSNRLSYKPNQNNFNIPNGGVAQLGEHLPCKQGVKSSNLSISIRWKIQCKSWNVLESAEW